MQHLLPRVPKYFKTNLRGEIHINAPDKDAITGQTFHLNLIAKEPDNLWSPSRIDPRFPQAAVYTDKMQFEEMDLQEAEFDLTPYIEKATGNESWFFHLTVTAPDGTYAATRAYYINELT